MKLSLLATVVALPSATSFVAKTPLAPHFSKASSTTKVNAVVDSSFLNDLPQHLDSLKDTLGSSFLLLADDATTDALTDAITAGTPPSAVEAVSTATDAAAASTDPGNGWFGFLAGPIKFLLSTFHQGFTTVGLQENAWGLSIIGMVLIIKALTFPLAQQQLESTTRMQALQPIMKDVQSKYQGNPEVANQKIAQLYQENNVNPLAGCIPSLVQIPIFIGLYRAVFNLAKEDKLNEPFLWLPNLEGPVYGADPTKASAWLLEGWTDAGPSLGWHDTIAFLSIPLILVVSQFLSINLMKPKDAPESDQSNQIIYKVLPFMVGWFSINVPAALGIYWIANNIITTAITVQIKNSVDTSNIKTPDFMASTASVVPQSVEPAFITKSKLQDQASGFGSSTVIDVTDIKPITASSVEDSEDDLTEMEKEESGSGMGESPATTKKRGGKKKKKRRN